MLYLLATILLNTVLFVFFKLFPKYKIDTLQAIVANYWTCVVIGSLLHGSYPVGADSVSHSWLPWSILMGATFISLFNLIGYCTIKDGMTTTTVANKLSLVIPVAFSIWLYNEQLSIVKVMGILIAFPAVYFTTRVQEDGKKAQSLWLPVLLFVGSGLLDTLVKYVEDVHLQDAGQLVPFTIHCFTTAGTLGLILVIILALSGKIKPAFRNVVAGVILGIPNYFSIYYLVKLLHSDFLQSSAAIPVNNIGIVLLSAVCGIALFREKAPASRLIGLGLSILAILLIALGD